MKYKPDDFKAMTIEERKLLVLIAIANELDNLNQRLMELKEK